LLTRDAQRSTIEPIELFREPKAGLRIQSEGVLLKKADIDLRNRLITVKATKAKNKTRRERCDLRLAEGSAGKEQERLGLREEGRATRLSSIRTSFETAVRNAKLSDDVTPHVLRHTFASRLVKAGVDLRTVQELGGWSGNGAALQSPDEAHKVDAVQRIANNSTTLSTTAENEPSERKQQVVVNQ